MYRWDLTTALQARDATRIEEIVARDRDDPPTILGSVLRDRERMALLVNAGVPLNLRDRIGYTPLVREEVKVETVRRLLHAGADLEARSGACLTPFMVRIKN
ncbi:MAG TPA: hypothetical protein VL242_42790 [Sorangium sp.]|nr:hypothetical protein [Sorangium sp.]